MLAGWDEECDRRAKEILFRCLEELGATKAALYLSGGEGNFELVTQYGFGRRDTLTTEIRAGHPYWDWIRRHRTSPAYLNDPAEDASLTRLLEGAGTARLLTVPLTLADRLVGFIDARDKARRLPWAAEDLDLARSIGAGLEGLIKERGLYGPPSHPAAAAAPPMPAAPTPAVAAGEGSLQLLARQNIEELTAFLRLSARAPAVGALGLTITDGSAVRTIVLSGYPLEQQEREALATHQALHLHELGLRLPPPSRWGWSEEEGGGAERRREEIRTAVLHPGPPVWIVLSVVSPAGSAAGETVLAAARRVAAQSVLLRNYRRAARNAARALLEPGEQSYPHLRQHSQTVSEIAQRMAGLIHCSDEDEELVTLAGFLHDVGMRELDYARLYRVERAGEAERRIFVRHPVVGARIVESIVFPGDLAAAIRHHHERWDGTGYPQRLSGRSIPLASRIIHLAEVWDVLTSSSSYKRPSVRSAALETIRGEAGRQFDPELVGVLEEAVRT
ncbi:MAG: HD domain-containing phosphohydrolase [Acidobacteriota bacterium]